MGGFRFLGLKPNPKTGGGGSPSFNQTLVYNAELQPGLCLLVSVAHFHLDVLFLLLSSLVPTFVQWSLCSGKKLVTEGEKPAVMHFVLFINPLHSSS